MAEPSVRPRGRGLQLTGAALVTLGVFVVVLTSAVTHTPGGAKLGVAVVVIGALLLAAAAVLRRLPDLRRR